MRIALRDSYQAKDGNWIPIPGGTQSTSERMCVALDIQECPLDPRFLNDPLRTQNAEALDDALQATIEKFDRDTLIALFEMHDATMVPCHNAAGIFEDPHYAARENIIAVEDEELGGPIRMQNLAANFPRRPAESAPPEHAWRA